MRGDGLSAEAWSRLAVTSVIWVILPLLVAVHSLLRSEVK